MPCRVGSPAGHMQPAITLTLHSSCCALCTGSVATEVHFDVLGVSPVSALSPLAPAVAKLWNSPNPYYMHDFAINGVRLLLGRQAARMSVL